MLGEKRKGTSDTKDLRKKGTMGTGWGEQYRWERGEKGTDEGRREGRRALIWGGRERTRDTKGQMGGNAG